MTFLLFFNCPGCKGPTASSAFFFERLYEKGNVKLRHLYFGAKFGPERPHQSSDLIEKSGSSRNNNLLSVNLLFERWNFYQTWLITKLKTGNISEVTFPSLYISIHHTWLNMAIF